MRQKNALHSLTKSHLPPTKASKIPLNVVAGKKNQNIALKACWDVSSFDRTVFIAVNKASAHKQQRKDKTSRQDSIEQVGFFFFPSVTARSVNFCPI